MTDFDKIFREYHHPLIIYCRKFIDNEADASDIVQNLFTLVWEQRKFKLEENHLKAYLFNAARNACLNHLKHAKVIRKFESEVTLALKEIEINYYNSGEQSLIQKEGLGKIYAAIDSLSAQQKEIIQLSRFEGLKNNEIADRLQVPVRTVETRLFRALKKLRTTLSQHHVQILFLMLSK